MTTLVAPMTSAAKLLANFLAPLGMSVCVSYVGRSGFVDLSRERVLRVDWFSDSNHHEHYDALLLRVVGKDAGELDRVVLRFADYFRPKRPFWQGSGGNPAKCEVVSYVDWDWYGPQGSDAGHPNNPGAFLDQVLAYYRVWE